MMEINKLNRKFSIGVWRNVFGGYKKKEIKSHTLARHEAQKAKRITTHQTSHTHITFDRPREKCERETTQDEEKVLAAKMEMEKFTTEWFARVLYEFY